MNRRKGSITPLSPIKESKTNSPVYFAWPSVEVSALTPCPKDERSDNSFIYLSSVFAKLVLFYIKDITFTNGKIF